MNRNKGTSCFISQRAKCIVEQSFTLRVNSGRVDTDVNCMHDVDKLSVCMLCTESILKCIFFQEKQDLMIFRNASETNFFSGVKKMVINICIMYLLYFSFVTF